MASHMRLMLPLLLQLASGNNGLLLTLIRSECFTLNSSLLARDGQFDANIRCHIVLGSVDLY